MERWKVNNSILHYAGLLLEEKEETDFETHFEADFETVIKNADLEILTVLKTECLEMLKRICVGSTRFIELVKEALQEIEKEITKKEIEKEITKKEITKKGEMNYGKIAQNNERLGSEL